MSVDSLFETLTIKDIKSKHINSRTEIETKKEELRFLVSERYRDVIDVADNIFDMKKFAEELNGAIKSIKNIHNQWDLLQVPINKPNKLQNEKSNEVTNKLSFAAQIKLILNMSDLIWNSLERHKFVDAAMLFSVCRNMSIHVQMTKDRYKDCDIDVQLMFSRQWNSLSNLEETITMICKRYLQSKSIQIVLDKAVECFIAIMIVESSSLNQMLDIYLKCKENVIKDWFSAANELAPIEKQLSSVINVVQSTFTDIQMLFIDSQIVCKLQALSSVQVNNMSCAKDEHIYHYLPEQISGFHPCQSIAEKNNSNLNEQQVANQLQAWLDRIFQEYSSKFSGAFVHLSTIKSVYEIHQRINNALNNVKHVNTNEDSLESVHRREMIKWLNLSEQCYQQRLEHIIQNKFNDVTNQWVGQISKFLETISRCISENEFDAVQFHDFIWTNNNRDINFLNSEIPTTTYISSNLSQESKAVFKSLNYHFSNSLNINSSISNKSCNFESLAIKFKAIRPEIHYITKNLNDQIYSMIIDLIDTIQDQELFIWNLLLLSTQRLFQQSIDWSKLQSNKIIVESKSSKILANKNPRDNLLVIPTVAMDQSQISKLIISQSLRSLIELTPALQAAVMTHRFVQCISATIKNQPAEFKSKSSTATSRKNKFLRLPFLPTKRHQCVDLEQKMLSEWANQMETLQDQVIYQVHQSYIGSIDSWVQWYFHLMDSGFSRPQNYQLIVTKWESTTPDEANPVNILQYPSQASWPMHELLLQLSVILVNCAMHSLSKNSQDNFRSAILSSILTNYDGIMTSSNSSMCLSKSCASTIESVNSSTRDFYQVLCVQLLFDLRFLLEIVQAKHNIEKSIMEQLRELLTKLEQQIDPFDYRMMSGPMHKSMLNCVAREHQLYHMLTCNSTTASVTTNNSTNNKQDLQHNLVELAPSCSNNVRFGLLPISGVSMNLERFNSQSKNF